MKSEALGVQQSIEGECQRHSTAQGELDALYASIFQGPTPSFPEEDEAERSVESALGTYNGSCAKLEADRQVSRILEEASKRIKSSLLDIEDALDASRLDMFGGDAAADAMERSSLHKAEMNVVQAQMLILQAQNICPAVASLPPVKIAQGNIMSDVLFDNIFSDLNFHDKIKDSRAEVQRCDQVARAQLAAAQERCQASEQQLKAHSGALTTARSELQRTRQRIFQRLADGGVGVGVSKASQGTSGEPEAPPAYS